MSTLPLNKIIWLNATHEVIYLESDLGEYRGDWQAGGGGGGGGGGGVLEFITGG